MKIDPIFGALEGYPPMIINPYAFSAGGGGGAVITEAAYVSKNINSGTETTYTFTAQDIGAADPDRHVVVCVGHRTTAARNIVSATIGGVTATIDIEEEGTTGVDCIAIIRAKVPTGTTADIVIELNSSSNRLGIMVYRVLKDAADLTIHHTDTNIEELVATLAINVEEDGYVIGGSMYRRGQDNVWTGLTRDDFQGVTGNAVGMSCASYGIASSAETGRAVTVTNTTYVTAVAIVSYK